jgi:beta-ureidopropionase / N-carbamoyl-L-amino-acid hydrolase
VITLEQLNALPPGEFAAALDGVFEHSPWVAQRTAAARPFASRLQLLDSMRAAVAAATPAEQLALIRAHPQLGVRARVASPLTTASAGEQRRAGLASCTEAQAARLEQINARYLERFGFPFILAVRGHDPESIIAHFERRLESELESERAKALNQIGAIAGYRLADMVAAPPAPEIMAMLERLAAATSGGVVAGMVREWMQCAGLEVWPAPTVDAPAGHLPAFPLVGRASGESGAKTLLTGVYHDPQLNALRYQGRAGFIIAIEVAQQLRHQGVRPSFNLAILAVTDDVHPVGAGSLLATTAPHTWVALDGAAAHAPDAPDVDIVGALRMAQLEPAAVTLVRQGLANGVPQPLNAFNADLAGQAARALEQSLRRVQAAA